MKDITALREAVYQTKKTMANEERLFLESKGISEKNKELFKGFVKHKIAAKDVSLNRQITYSRYLRYIMQGENKPLDSTTDKEDITRIVNKLKKREWGPWTMATCLKVLKVYMRWVYGYDKTDPTPDCVKWIEISVPKNGLQPNDLLTLEEFRQLMKGTSTLKYKSMLSLSYELGPRPNELLCLQLKDISFNKDHTEVTLKALKTKNVRTLFSFNSHEIMRLWIAEHPDKGSPNAWLFPQENNINKPLTVLHWGRIVMKARKKSGLQKRVWPYLLRHTAGTRFYRDYGPMVAAKLLDHSPNSKQAITYTHLSSQDVFQTQARAVGKGKEEIIIPGKCEVCDHLNGYEAEICSQCSNKITGKLGVHTVIEREERQEELEKKIRELSVMHDVIMEDSEAREAFRRAVNKLKSHPSPGQ